MKIRWDKTLYYFLLLLVLVWSGCQEVPSSVDIRHEVAPASPTSISSGTERVIVAFGNSLTAGFGVSLDEAYPALLEKRMKEGGYPYHVINAGVSGETSAGGLRRVDWVLRNQPDIVILELGANDGLRGLELGQIERNLAAIIERLQKGDVQVILAGMKMPPNYGKDYTEGFEKIYPRLAARYQVALIPFFLDGVAAHSQLNQADGIHPTAQGYKVIVDQIWPILKPLLEKWAG